MDDGTEPVENDELLYRRVPEHWYSSASGFDSQAFAPHKAADLTGLSISRAKYKSVADAAKGKPGKSYYVAILRTSELRKNGIEVVPCPRQGDPGHAELPDLTSANRKDDRTLELQRVLEQITVEVKGPYKTDEEQTT